MIEKCQVIKCHTGDRPYQLICERRVLATFLFKENAQNLCAKLNRLAALEAVCREIIESASLEKHGSSFSTAFLKGSEVAERQIAQKLKAVLEEK